MLGLSLTSTVEDAVAEANRRGDAIDALNLKIAALTKAAEASAVVVEERDRLRGENASLSSSCRNVTSSLESARADLTRVSAELTTTKATLANVREKAAADLAALEVRFGEETAALREEIATAGAAVARAATGEKDEADRHEKTRAELAEVRAEHAAEVGRHHETKKNRDDAAAATVKAHRSAEETIAQVIRERDAVRAMLERERGRK